MNVQLDLFENSDELSLLRKELEVIQDSNRRCHKSQFAKISGVGKGVLDLREEMDRVKDDLYKEIAKLKSEIESLRKMLVKDVK